MTRGPNCLICACVGQEGDRFNLCTTAKAIVWHVIRQGYNSIHELGHYAGKTQGHA